MLYTARPRIPADLWKAHLAQSQETAASHLPEQAAGSVEEKPPCWAIRLY